MPQQNDVGVKIAATIQDEGTALNLGSATTTDFLVKIGGATVTWGATVVDATGGKIEYTTTSSDLSAVGRVEIQAHIVIGTQNFKTQITHFDIFPNL